MAVVERSIESAPITVEQMDLLYLDETAIRKLGNNAIIRVTRVEVAKGAFYRERSFLGKIIQPVSEVYTLHVHEMDEDLNVKTTSKGHEVPTVVIPGQIAHGYTEIEGEYVVTDYALTRIRHYDIA